MRRWQPLRKEIVMKKSITILCGLFVAATLFAYDAEALLKKAEESTAFYGLDFKGNYSIVQSKPGEGNSSTEAIMYRRDSEGKWTILVTGPSSEKGKGYLQFDGNIWFFDPTDRRFTFTNAKDKFQSSNANTSDFAPQRYASDYAIVSHEQVKLGALDCVLFELEAKVQNVDYPRLKLWVTVNDGLVRMKEDYSLSGQKLRTTAVPSYQAVKSDYGTFSVPVKMLITDNLRGKKIGDKVQYEKTQVTISNVSFGHESNAVYTKAFLETQSN